jgi:hypothetical protein
MKRWRTLALGTALIVALAAGCGRGGAEHYGEPFTGAPETTIARLLEAPDRFQRQPVRVKGTIERQCPAAGCWLFLSDGQGLSIRVELGDYFPRLPQRVGASAEVEGEWIRRGDHHEFVGTRITFVPKESP